MTQKQTKECFARMKTTEGDRLGRIETTSKDFAPPPGSNMS